MKELHIVLPETHPAYVWANSMADKVGARGHVGTHLDCYTSQPDTSRYEISGYVIDCRDKMPDCLDILNLPLHDGMAILLHTGNMEKHGYGSEEYFGMSAFLTDEALSVLLEKNPKFIIIDSHGIGEKGKRHTDMDKQCESLGCHVIENVDLSSVEDIDVELIIEVDLENKSTGKPCKVFCR